MQHENEPRKRRIVAGDHDRTIIRRISWGAVIAGFLLATVVNITLNLLGVGIGLGSINPTESNGGGGALGIGSVIWYIISAIISLFAGGWIAAHLAGLPTRWDSILHGLLTWCLFTIFSFYLLTTAVGKIIGAAGSVVGKGFSLVGQGASAVAPEIADMAKQELEQSDISIQKIKEEAKEILSQTGKEDLQPENLENQAEKAGEQVKKTTDDPAQLDEVIQRVFAKGDSIISDVDKQAIVNVIVARSDKSRAEAEKIVNKWVNQYEEARQKFNEMKQEAEEKARKTAEDVASAASTAAIAAFFWLLIGAGASLAGGFMGRPKHLVETIE